MARETTRTPSRAEEFPRAVTKTIEVDGTRGADGLPLVVTIRPVPLMRAIGFSRLKDVENDDPRLAEAFHQVAAQGLVEPRIGDISWDDLSLRAQSDIVSEVVALTMQGAEVASEEAEKFPGDGAGGVRDGGAGGRPGDAGEHAGATPPHPAG